jgi:hypothetical protein
MCETTKKIDDFGEKIGGAKKDKYTKTVADISASDWETLPLSKLIPPIDAVKFDDTNTAAACFTVRSMIERRPAKSYKLKRWIEKVKTAAQTIELLKNGDMTSMDFASFIGNDNVAMMQLLESLPVELWNKIDTVKNYSDSYRVNNDGTHTKSPVIYVNKSRFEYVDNFIECLNDIIKSLGSENKKDISFACYRETSTGVRFICAKSDKEKRHLIEFKTREEMHDFYVNNRPALVAMWEAVKECDNVTEKSTRRAVNDAKTGAFFRSGDISPALFNETFKFKGVEFGNWVSQGGGGRQRQWMLNRAFDGLIDLARLLNIEPAALSLGGSLSLAFGARGNSGASAHFESGYFVINLTKNNGAGSLAHEWFHALDNYLSKQNGNRLGFATDKPENYGVELSPALIGLVSALNDSPMKARAELIDKGKSKKYWATIVEMAARSFECFVIDGLQQIGVKNDYLANVTTFTEFAKNGGRYPYQTPEELPPVSAAFSELFAVLKQSNPVFSADFAMVATDFMEVLEVEAVEAKPTPRTIYHFTPRAALDVMNLLNVATFSSVAKPLEVPAVEVVAVSEMALPVDIESDKITLVWSEASDAQNKDFKSLDDLQRFICEECDDTAKNLPVGTYDKHKIEFNGAAIRFDVGLNDGDFNPFGGSLYAHIVDIGYGSLLQPKTATLQAAPVECEEVQSPVVSDDAMPLTVSDVAKPSKVSSAVMPFENESRLTIEQITENRTKEFKAIDLFTGELNTLAIFSTARNTRIKKLKGNIKKITRLYFGTWDNAPKPCLISKGYKVAVAYTRKHKIAVPEILHNAIPLTVSDDAKPSTVSEVKNPVDAYEGVKVFKKPVSVKSIFQYVVKGWNAKELSDNDLIKAAQYAHLASYQQRYGLFPKNQKGGWWAHNIQCGQVSNVDLHNLIHAEIEARGLSDKACVVFHGELKEKSLEKIECNRLPEPKTTTLQSTPAQENKNDSDNSMVSNGNAGINTTPVTKNKHEARQVSIQSPNKEASFELKPRSANLSKMARAGIMILGWHMARELFNAAGQGKVREFLSQGLKMAWAFDTLTDADFSRFFAACNDEAKRAKVYALYCEVMQSPKPISDFNRLSAPIEYRNNYSTMPPPENRRATQRASLNFQGINL